MSATAPRPRIGVTGSVRGGLWMWWFNRLAVWRAGGEPIRITADRPHSFSDLDGLIVGGGDDISAQLYHGDVTLTVKVDPERDALEKDYLERADDAGIPVLGICRGAQMLSVVRGGSLHQDIYSIYEELPRQRTVLPRKRVEIDRQSRLYDVLHCASCRVNVLHHQAIDRLGRDLVVVARDGHGMIQGIEQPGERFVTGVQWHPEFLIFSTSQQALFRALCAAAAQERRAEDALSAAVTISK